MTPEEIAERQFSRERRGYDRDEVRAFLASISAHLVEIEARVSLAAATLDQPPPDPYEGIGRDVTSVLKSAEEWAARVRADADQDATAIRARAGVEADELRAESTALKTEADEIIETAAAERSALDERLSSEERRIADQSRERLDDARDEADRIMAAAATESESIRRKAEDDASNRSREILSASQDELDRLLTAQTDVHARLQSALNDVQTAVATASGSSVLPPPPDIDLTGLDEPDSAGSAASNPARTDEPKPAADLDDPSSDHAEVASDDDGAGSSTSSGDDPGGDRLAEVVRDAVSRALRERS